MQIHNWKVKYYSVLKYQWNETKIKCGSHTHWALLVLIQSTFCLSYGLVILIGKETHFCQHENEQVSAHVHRKFYLEQIQYVSDRLFSFGQFSWYWCMSLYDNRWQPTTNTIVWLISRACCGDKPALLVGYWKQANRLDLYRTLQIFRVDITDNIVTLPIWDN